MDVSVDVSVDASVDAPGDASGDAPGAELVNLSQTVALPRFTPTKIRAVDVRGFLPGLPGAFPKRRADMWQKGLAEFRGGKNHHEPKGGHRVLSDQFDQRRYRLVPRLIIIQNFRKPEGKFAVPPAPPGPDTNQVSQSLRHRPVIGKRGFDPLIRSDVQFDILVVRKDLREMPPPLPPGRIHRVKPTTTDIIGHKGPDRPEARIPSGDTAFSGKRDDRAAGETRARHIKKRRQFRNQSRRTDHIRIDKCPCPAGDPAVTKIQCPRFARARRFQNLKRNIPGPGLGRKPSGNGGGAIGRSVHNDNECQWMVQIIILKNGRKACTNACFFAICWYNNRKQNCPHSPQAVTGIVHLLVNAPMTQCCIRRDGCSIQYRHRIKSLASISL